MNKINKLVALIKRPILQSGGIKKLSLILVVTLAGCIDREPQPNNPLLAPAMPTAPAAPAYNTGAIYNDTQSVSLYEDRKAHRVGDILTVVLVETTNLDKQANTTTTKTLSTVDANPTVFGIQPQIGNNNLSQNLNSSNTFTGTGESKQLDSLNGTITVTVAKVLSNGNLMIRGEKWLHLDQGKEYVQLTGIVRQDDVTIDNTINSTQVADARIAYAGTGFIAQNNTPGWLGRFFMGAFEGLFPF